MKSKAYQRQLYNLNGQPCSRKFNKVVYDSNGFEDATKKGSSLMNTFSRRTRTMKIVEDKGKRQRINLSTRKNVGTRAFVTTYALAERSEENDSDNDVCSVGSCSVNYSRQEEFSRRFTKYPSRLRKDLHFSDAESHCCSYHNDDVCHEIAKNKAEVSVHDLELRAYRSTLEAFYVFGPLSWEQEELLTNLRITLHISNDEHSRELRNLISSGTRK